MSPVRFFLLCAVILLSAPSAHADDPQALLTRVRASISAHLPLVAEGKLQTQYKDEQTIRAWKVCRWVVNGSETETWQYQGVNVRDPDASNFFMVLPNAFTDPLDPVSSDALAATAAGKPILKMSILPREQIDGTDYDVVEITQTLELGLGQQPIWGTTLIAKSVVRKLYIGQDGLVHRISGELLYADSTAPAGKPTPVQKTPFVINITSYRKAVIFPPRPRSQPADRSFVFSLQNNWLPGLFGISQDGRTVAFGLPQGDIYMGDTRTGKAGVLLKARQEPWQFLALSPDASRLITASPKLTTVWNADSGKELYTLHDLPDITNLTFAPNGKSVVITGNNGFAELLEVETGRVLHTFDKLNWGQYTFSPDGAYLAAFIGFQVTLWNTRTWEPIPVEGNNIVGNGRIAFSPDGGRFALGGDNGVVTLWDRTGHKLLELKGAAGDIGAVWFSPDGHTLTALDADERGDGTDLSTGLTVWDTTSGQVTNALTLSSGNHAEGAYMGHVANTFLLPDQFCQFDPSAHSIKFWKLPIVSARP